MAFITKRNGTWYLYWYQDGKKRGRSLKTDRKMVAEHYLKEFEHRLVTNQLQQATDITLTALKDRYLQYSKTNKTRRTYESHDLPRITQFIDYMLSSGVKKLSQVTLRHINEFKEQRLAEVKPRTVLHDLYAVSGMFSYAVEMGYATDNIVRKVKKIKVEKNLPRYLSHEELDKVFETARETHLWLLTATAYYAGLRNAELCSLEWPDIDFEHNLVTVRNKDDFQTKSKEARTVPLNETLREILLPCRREKGYCFLTPGGRRYAPRILSKDFTRLVVKPSGVPDFSLHTLRHTFASHLVMKGVSIYKVSQWLGHKDVTTTMIYAHLAPQDGEINKI